ncbi:hypothetical protein IMCC21906_02228 [Spongiibacter sp. IMCC21906]|uniref:hypothetical protein n=1 Tax=Spongiibacter sp. IMCC21906 TaxID=1620392 RepID=UPI00062DE3F9|nr:hypothetical protein [Spongiibacter sp. IMCC21906]AKH69891.1 hypothetical protein IMCC21906_02228 [Spongiibacter sp. IMCC21906]
MTTAAAFYDILRPKLQAFFDDQKEGLDIPPGVLYRLEGQMQLGVEMNLIDEVSLRKNLVEMAESVLGSEAAQCYRDDHRLILHLQMPAAPVHPSTGASKDSPATPHDD